MESPLKGMHVSPATEFKVGHQGMVRDLHPHWGGGKTMLNGYICVLVGINRYKPEHRLIMEKHLGRKLRSDEIVHHKNGKKTDNRIKNLQLVTRAEHIAIHRQGLYKSRRKRRRYVFFWN